jgi:hypothetical protein
LPSEKARLQEPRFADQASINFGFNANSDYSDYDEANDYCSLDVVRDERNPETADG